MCRFHGNVNKYNQAFKIEFTYLKEIWSVDFFYNLSLVERSLEYLKLSSVNFHFFNTPVSYFLKCFRAKFREILTSGSPEIGLFPRKLFRIQSQFYD